MSAEFICELFVHMNVLSSCKLSIKACFCVTVMLGACCRASRSVGVFGDCIATAFVCPDERSFFVRAGGIIYVVSLSSESLVVVLRPK